MTTEFLDLIKNREHFIHELNTQWMKLEIEEEELQAALEETGMAMEQKEGRLHIS